MKIAARDRKRAKRGPNVTAPVNQDGSPASFAVHACGHAVAIDATDAYKRFVGPTEDCPTCAAGGRPQEPPDAPQVSPPMPEAPKVPEPDAAWVAAHEALLPQGVVFHEALAKLVLMIESDVPVWAQGPSGTGKTTIAEQSAAALGLSFHSIQVHPKMTESALFGWTDGHGKVHRSPLWDAFEHGGLFLLDEVDNGNQALIAGLNSAVANGFALFAGEYPVTRHPSFRTIATANTAGLGPTAGFLGRSGVDLATRDRFLTLFVPIDEEMERGLYDLYRGADDRTMARHAKGSRAIASRVLNEHAANREAIPEPAQVLAEVHRVRRAVEDRFDSGMVVTPRTTYTAAKLLDQGFSLREIIGAKLVGLQQDQLDAVLGGTA